MLKNKKVLITGSTGGIGHAICELFTSQNADLFITNISEEPLISLAQELRQANPNINVFYKTCNLSNESDIIEFVKTANEKMNGIDVLIGNAGMNIDTLTLR